MNDTNKRLKQLEAAEFEAINTGNWNPSERSLAEWIEDLVIRNKQLKKELERSPECYCGICDYCVMYRGGSAI